jgi:hypothetical protein
MRGRAIVKYCLLILYKTMAQEKVVQIQQPSGHQSPQASLLGLPRELRDIIYEYCLPTSTIKHSLQSPCLPLFGAGLRRTCRQLYHETRDLSWTRGALLLRNPSRGDIIYTSIRSKPTYQISRVVLQAKLPDPSIAQSMMAVRILEKAGSWLAASLTPGDIIIQICTCKLKNMKLGIYLRTMVDLQYAVTELVRAWPSIERVAFFYCHDSDPASNTDGFPSGPDWRFPSTWRSAFGPDARYFGPWNPEKEEGLDGEEGAWRLKYYDGRGRVTRTTGLDFFNVADVYGARCALDVENEITNRINSLDT